MNLLKAKCNNIVDVKVVPVKKCIAIYNRKIEPVSHLRIITYKNSDIQIYPIMQSQVHGIAVDCDPSIDGLIRRNTPTVYFDSIPKAHLNELAADIVAPRGLSCFIGSQTHSDVRNTLCAQVCGLGLTVTE